MERLTLDATVLKAGSEPEQWAVEAISAQSGDIYSALFWGPEAKLQAEEYAREKFTSYEVR